MENEHHCQVGEITTSYKVFGSLSEPIRTVLLHGWGAKKELFDSAAREIRARSGSAVLTVDFPGFGKSSPPLSVWSTKDFSEWLKEFLEVIDVRTISMLGGHSHGGRVSIQFCHDYPALVEKLLLIDSAGVPPRRSPRMKARIALFKSLKKILLLLLPNGEFQKKSLAQLGALFGSRDYKDAGVMRDTMVRVINENLVPLLPQILQPTLLVWGDQDQDTPVWMAKEIECQIPDAGLVIWKGAGHFSFLDRPAEFSLVASKFLTG